LAGKDYDERRVEQIERGAVAELGLLRGSKPFVEPAAHRLDRGSVELDEEAGVERRHEPAEQPGGGLGRLGDPVLHRVGRDADRRRQVLGRDRPLRLQPPLERRRQPAAVRGPTEDFGGPRARVGSFRIGRRRRHLLDERLADEALLLRTEMLRKERGKISPADRLGAR
jgi:hypothetical protein